MGGNQIASYMPDYQAAVFPEKPTVFAAEGSIFGLCGFAASLMCGAVSQRLFARLPAVSLYYTAYGSIGSSVFMAITIFARNATGGSADAGCARSVSPCLTVVLSCSRMTPERVVLPALCPKAPDWRHAHVFANKQSPRTKCLKQMIWL
jgi:hypothetical protein